MGRQKREVLHQPQSNSALSLAARKGIAGHYEVDQPNHTFSDRSYAGGSRGGHPLTLSSTNPGQGMEVDGALGSTTVGVMEGDGTSAACKNNREGKGATTTQNQGGKILLNNCPPVAF